MHNLIPFLLTEAILAGIIWLIRTFITDATIKMIMNGVTILFAVLYLIQFLGLYHFGLSYLVPHIGG